MEEVTAVADVGIHFDEEVAADNHRLGFGWLMLARCRAAAATSSRTNSGVMFSGRRAKLIPGCWWRSTAANALAAHIFTDGDELHFGMTITAGVV